MDRKEIDRIFAETDRRIDVAFRVFSEDMIRLIREAWIEATQKAGLSVDRKSLPALEMEPDKRKLLPSEKELQ